MSNENSIKKRKSPPRRPALDRVIDKVIPIPESGCWLFIGASGDKGHGIILDNNQRLTKAHRVVYRDMVGPIPEGMFVCHKCDVPFCVNPLHLFIGSAADNNKDMRDKGRSSPPPRNTHDVGEYRYNSKLTNEIVIDMRKRHSEGISIYRLAKDHKIKWSTAKKIIERKSWRHL